MTDPTLRIDAARLVRKSIVAFECLAGQWRRSLELTANERLALLHLGEAGPLTISDLGDRIPLSRGAMTGLADRLAQRGFVARRADVRDRRRIVLEMTPAGFGALEPLSRPYDKAIQQLADALTEAEWQAVMVFLEGFQQISARSAAALRDLPEGALADLVHDHSAGAPQAK